MELSEIRKKVALICKASDIKMLGVFGSVARGEDSIESDVDLLVKFHKPVGFFELHDIEQKLQAAFGRRVDLGTEASLHPLIRAGVKKDLKIIYEG
jgi:predicted nucleotidyltransferase